MLLDDPAAELDSAALARLLEAVRSLGCQVVATSLEKEVLDVPRDARLFHVEQGVLQAAGQGQEQQFPSR